MDGIFFLLVVLLHSFLLIALFAYGINFYYLAILAWRNDKPDPVPPNLDELPYVTVQLPLYNELHVAERLINSVVQLEWDPARLEIQALDDSTDETRDIIARTVERWRAQGVNIVHLHRSERTGFKAGALADGMQSAQGEFIAYFDSDFLPPPDFLKRTVPHLVGNPRLAFVQTRWGHVNREYSLLTFLQSLAIDAHFMVEQFARSRGGYWFNFNGTAGVWRRDAINDAGGWKQDTLTEDLDLSYRAFLKGWQAMYLRDTVAPAELPVTFNAYRRQQHRWSKGSLECALKLLPQVWSTNQPLPIKIESTFHLTGYGIHLLMFLLILDFPLVLYFSQSFPDVLVLFGIGALFNLTAFAPAAYFTLAQKQIGEGWWKRIPAIMFITALGAGMIMTTVRAGSQIVFGKQSNFERTPKFGIAHRGDKWVNKRYHLQLDYIVIAEALVGIWIFFTLLYAIYLREWVITLYSAIFFVGVLFVTGLTLAQTFRVHRYQKKLLQLPADSAA
jgi:cellulose synthase/poly-beta-1,6-N-acetylglucosamine synthase-like glycosyltransferase